MTASQTSILAYTDLIKTAELGRRLEQYLEALSTFAYGASDRDVRERIHSKFGEMWELGIVSARRNNAIEQGLVYEAGEKLDEKTGKHVNVWRLRVRL